MYFRDLCNVSMLSVKQKTVVHTWPLSFYFDDDVMLTIVTLGWSFCADIGYQCLTIHKYTHTPLGLFITHSMETLH